MSHKIRPLLFFICFISFIANAADFKEGTDYKVITVANNILQAPKNQVSVVEFFSPGCPWCFKLEPALKFWLKQKPAYVKFSREPLSFEAGWESYQKAYFVAEALHKENTILPALFKAIHVDNQPLTSEADLTKFFATQGIAPTTFQQLYNSPSIALEIYRTNDLMNTYKIYEIPTIIVNGKYIVSAGMAQGDDKKMIQILNYVIAKARS